MAHLLIAKSNINAISDQFSFEWLLLEFFYFFRPILKIQPEIF